MNIGLILTLIAFLFVAFSLLTGKIPPSIACGLSVAFLWVVGVLDMEEVFANFVSSNIIVMVGMMIVIAALLKTSILYHIAGLVRRSKGNSLRTLLWVAMLVPFILCQFIGGVTSMITVIPLLIGLAAEMGISPTLLVLPASVGAQTGLHAMPIGSAAATYLMKNQIIANVGGSETMGFWDLFASRIPGSIATLIFIALVGYKLLPKRELGEADMLEERPNLLKKSELPRWKEIAAYVIFFGSMILMILNQPLGLNNAMISTVAALLCGLLGLLDEKEMYRSVNWTLIFMMSFMLAISTAMANSGAGELLANALSGVFGLGSERLIVAIIFLVCAFLTQLMDNTALVNIFSPIVVIACMQNGISCLPMMAAVDSSCLVSYCTPLASPSALMAYKLGGYSIKEMLKFSIPLILISAVVSIIWIPIYFSL